MVARAVLVVALAVLSMGCRAAKCERLCERNNACAGAPKSDCKAQCAEADQLSRSAGCEGRFDELAGCSEKQEDACAAGGCAAERKMYEDCLTRYCAKNPSATGCR